MFDFSPLLLVGAGAIVVGLSAAALIVWNDLGPVARLSTPQRFALIAALGGGVIAFALKLTVIETLAHASRDRLAPTLAVSEATAPTETIEIGRPVWQPLPFEAPAPLDDPLTPEKVELGRRLFFDTALSRDGTLSCASCHDLYTHAGGDGRATAIGIDGQVGPRNSPTVWNTAFQARLFWDGRARSLEEQALGPIANPIEMGADLADVVARLGADAGWREGFARAFGDGAAVDERNLARALAAYERTLITPDAPFDRFLRGDASAMTAQQLRGMSLFETIGCVVCHAGPGFSRAGLLAPEHGSSAMRLFPSLASPIIDKYDLTKDLGAAKGGDRGLWRVPSLRNVALTGPYFHNGSVADLAEAVRIMATVQVGRVVGANGPIEPIIEWSPEMQRLTRRTPSPLSEAEVADIVAFLGSLTSDMLAEKARAAKAVAAR